MRPTRKQQIAGNGCDFCLSLSPSALSVITDTSLKDGSCVLKDDCCNFMTICPEYGLFCTLHTGSFGKFKSDMREILLSNPRDFSPKVYRILRQILISKCWRFSNFY